VVVVAARQATGFMQRSSSLVLAAGFAWDGKSEPKYGVFLP
jgi:hypothetical protein